MGGVWRDKKYSAKIGYGIGQYYEKTKEELSKIVKLDYLCDRKWDGSDVTEYDGTALVRREDLNKIGKVLVIIFTGTLYGYKSIKMDLDYMGVDYIHVDEIIGKAVTLNGKILKDNYPGGVYEDEKRNRIEFECSISDNFTVTFQGYGNVLHIDKNVLIGNLYIHFGNNGFCSIGESTEILGAKFYLADSKIQIGKDCLLSNEVVLRTHDAHHIFDIETHQRVNFSKDILVKDNVWIAYGVTLLGGAVIGTGSVVGTNAVTSGVFEHHQIIAGSPAKVIRENICWSRDNTAYFNRSCLEECISKEALKYLNEKIKFI